MTVHTRVRPVFFTVVFLAYTVGRIIASIPALNEPRSLADTPIYLRISQHPVLSVELWGTTRPFVFPLLLKITQQDIVLTAWVQLGFSILAWGLLAWMISRFFSNPWLAMSSFGLILALSLDRHITSWDFVMLTESLSVSFLALFIAVFLWLLRHWSIGRFLLLVVTAFLFAFTRDTNAWILLFLAGLILVAVLLRWVDRRALLLTVSFILIFFLSDENANLGDRWIFPLGNLIGQRVLPDNSARGFFESSCSMPVSPALLRLSGKYANSYGRAMYLDPELESFRGWLRSDGKSCYMKWLIANSMDSIGEALNEFDDLITFRDVDRFFAKRFNPLMPVVVGRLFYPEAFALWIWVGSTVAALIATWKKMWNINPLWALFICLNLLVFPHLFLTWHGDAMAPDRHALSVGVQLYLSFWLLVLLLIEYLWVKPGSNIKGP